MNVSIVIPAHNAAETLAETLASLRAQTLPDWEAIVDYRDADYEVSITVRAAV